MAEIAEITFSDRDHKIILLYDDGKTAEYAKKDRLAYLADTGRIADIEAMEWEDASTDKWKAEKKEKEDKERKELEDKAAAARLVEEIKKAKALEDEKAELEKAITARQEKMKKEAEERAAQLAAYIGNAVNTAVAAALEKVKEKEAFLDTVIRDTAARIKNKKLPNKPEKVKAKLPEKE